MRHEYMLTNYMLTVPKQNFKIISSCLPSVWAINM